jgi:2-keto-4-pentenoate hydratase/2-oxohepta-3-ene-1,7-dioic acid hydratase in catechol pathway
VLTEDGILDAGQLLRQDEPIDDVMALIRRASPVTGRLAEALGRFPAVRPVPLDGTVLLPPVLQPPSVRDHIAFEEHASRQFTRAIADVWLRRPIHYYSNPSRLLGHCSAVPMPATERLDYELEIAAVIGAEACDVTEDEAMAAVLGFTILNDWSARDLQADEMAYGLGPAKGKDFAASLGPWVVTLDELGPALRDGVLDLRCQVRVNGVTWADSNSAAQYHTWGAMLEHASQDSRLLPGDIIASGTVAAARSARRSARAFPPATSCPATRSSSRWRGWAS